MVHCLITSQFFVVLKQWEFRYPQEIVHVLVKKIHSSRKFQTKIAENIVYYFIFICGEQKKVTRLSCHRFYKGIQFFLCHKFGKRRFVGAILIDAKISQSFCAVVFGKIYQ